MNPVDNPEANPVAWRLRGDLQFVFDKSVDGGKWTIKDPLQLKYFQIDAEEYDLLRMLDGKSSLGSLLQRLRAQFPQADLNVDHLRTFISMAVSGGLLMSSVPGVGGHVLERSRQQTRGRVHRVLMSLLSFRLRGLDPTRLLDALNSLVGGLMTRRWLAIMFVYITIALLVMFSRLDQVYRELPEIGRLFAPGNLMILGLAFTVVKILHELGHGVACRRVGGECHELGVLFVAFFPLLYCDVSDTWIQSNRRLRMLVAAAGIGTEFLIASTCTFLWVFSVPGAMHLFFLNVILVCSLNTLLINGNPLLRYDGYFVLSDLLNRPNLGQEATQSATQFLARLIFGTPIRKQGMDSGSAFLTVFGFASITYRLSVVIALHWVIYRVLTPFRLEFLVIAPASLTAAAMILQVKRFVHTSMRVTWENGVRWRAMVGCGSTIFGLAVLLVVPLPHSMTVPCILNPGTGFRVYAAEDGFIHSMVKLGQQVHAGDCIAELTNPEIDWLSAEAATEISAGTTRLTAVSSIRNPSSELRLSLPVTEQLVNSARNRMQKLAEVSRLLAIRSPKAGIVIPARNIPEHSDFDEKNPVFWTGQPLGSVNEGAWIPRTTHLCTVAVPSDFRISCLVSQIDTEFIELEAKATVILLSGVNEPISAVVTHLRGEPESFVDRELAITGLVAVTDYDTLKPREKLFNVELSVRDSSRLPPVYSTGHARIKCRPLSLLSRISRFLRATFSEVL